MSDERPGSEQQGQSAQPEPPAGNRWGDPIEPERTAELKELADQQRAWASAPDHQGRASYFKDVPLTGADVFWLAAYALAGPDGDVVAAQERLRTARKTDEYIDLYRARPEGAVLREAHLERAVLEGAHLEEAVLRFAHLEGAYLHGAHLEGADLRFAHLEGAVLRHATLDSTTQLDEVTLGEPRSTLARLLRHAPKWGNASLGDIRWEGPPDLTRVRWESLPRLGDERGVGWRTTAISTTTLDHRDVVRAYRQVAAQLRAQGLSEEADRFAERGQIRRRQQTFRELLEDWRRPWRLPGDLLRWLFSWVLAGLAGYGYHPGRSVFWYLATIAGFAFAYYQVTRGFVPFGLPTQSSLAPLTWYEAGILSVSSFHGRGFFQPLQSLGDPVAALASIEAVIGLFIEISFIATFTQRFFGSK